VNQRKIGELVNHDVWINLCHRAGQCRRVENIHHDGLDAPAPQLLAARSGTRGPKDQCAGTQE
jgi:hypothetical protein